MRSTPIVPDSTTGGINPGAVLKGREDTVGCEARTRCGHGHSGGQHHESHERGDALELLSHDLLPLEGGPMSLTK